MTNDDAWVFQAVIPAGTPKTAPVTILTVFESRIVNAIRWRVPPGPSGLMGFVISMRGVQVFPQMIGQWIVANGESEQWPVANQPDSGDWSVTGYNTGGFAHSVYVTYLTSVIRTPEPVRQLGAIDLVGPVPDLSGAGPPLRLVQ